MCDQSEEQIEVKDDGASRKETRSLRRRLGFVVMALYMVTLLFLLVMYLFVGDGSAFGEFITIWPPLAWLFGMVPLAVVSGVLTSRRGFVLVLGGLLIFVLLTEEWRSLLRWGDADAEGSIRVLVWNVDSHGGETLLQTMEAYEPDICILQESADGDGSFTPEDLTGYWEGFHWLDSGDCAVLSRFAIEALPTERVGPWQAPQMLQGRLPDDTFFLMVNVRLMLPSFGFNPFSERFGQQHDLRVNQYGQLAELIRNAKIQPVLLAGDFNVSATAKSLGPIRKNLDDAWKSSGRGWGRTITANFPVSRIDQCWVSGFEPLSARVYDPPFSDHRILVVDLTDGKQLGIGR